MWYTVHFCLSLMFIQSPTLDLCPCVCMRSVTIFLEPVLETYWSEMALLFPVNSKL